MALRVITPASQEPVTLADAKNHLRLEESVDDVYVQALITAARQHIEKVCWRRLLVTTLQLELPAFRGADKFELAPKFTASGGAAEASASERFQPYIELAGGHLADTPGIAVTYLDVNGVTQTLSPATYAAQGVGIESDVGRLWLTSGSSWPSTLDRFDAVKITYAVGWTPAKLPRPLVQAVLLLVSQMYEYRTPEITGTIATKLEFTIDALTSAYRLVRL